MTVKNSTNFFWRQIVEVYRQVFSLFKKNPTIWLPFIFLGFVNFVALMVLYLAPSPPFSYILAPIIRTFWGEQFLHYPDNFILLPRLFHHANVFVISLISVFITGIVIKKIESENTSGESVSTQVAARAVWRRYISLFVVWVVSFSLSMGLLKVVLAVTPRIFALQFGISLLTLVVMQALLCFLPPAILISQKGFFKSSWEGLVFGARHWVLTSVMIFLPVLLVTAISFLKAFTPMVIRFSPEVVLWILVFGVAISIMVDLVVTSAVTVLFLKQEGSFAK